MRKIYTLFILAFACSFSYAQVEGTWQIAPEPNSLAVGPGLGDFSWWSINADEVIQRSCYYDDLFVFRADGTFVNMHGSETWLEEWQNGGPDAGCGAPVAPHDGSNAATWTYNDNNRTVTLNGVGAYLGLPKVNNSGEIDDPANAPASITYPANIQGDRMTIDISFGPGFWHYELVRVTGTTSVSDITEDAFTFSPNPVSDELYINSEEAIDVFTIRDMTGRIVLQRKNMVINESIDVSSFDSGIYLLESRSGDQQTVKRVVVK
jgi:hypothetical protein